MGIKNQPPFPSDPHYDAKAWEYCVKHKGHGAFCFGTLPDRHNLNIAWRE